MVPSSSSSQILSRVPFPVVKKPVVSRSDYLRLIAERVFHQNGDHSLLITDARKADNPIVFVNRACIRLNGYDREELLGRNCRLFRGPETCPETVRILREAVSRAKPLRVDILAYSKKGEGRWTRLRMRPMFDELRQVRSFVGIQIPIRATEVIPSPFFG
ncbi:MAG: hypothetical protein RJB62_498 [Pseudomonadota bacterium]|jgi:PAS domain S-box-containing protein